MTETAVLLVSISAPPITALVSSAVADVGLSTIFVADLLESQHSSHAPF